MVDQLFIIREREARPAEAAADSFAVEKIREFCVTWERAVKTIGLYPVTNSLPDEFRHKFYNALIDVLDTTGGFELTVGDSGFEYQGTKVYERDSTEDNLAYMLFRDGICRLAFETAVKKEECVTFLAALADAFSAPNTRIDVVNRLWQEALPHIRHFTLDRLVEGSYIEIADDREIETKHERFASDRGPSVPLQEPDVDAPEQETASPYRGFQQDRFLHVQEVFGDVTALTDAEKERLESFKCPESESECEQLGIDILFEILRTETASRLGEEAVAVTEKQLQHSIQADRWDLVEVILENWYLSTQQAPERVGRRVKAAQQRIANPKHFDALAQYLNTNPQSDLCRVRRIIERLGPFAPKSVTAMLGVLEHRAARMMVCDYLSEHGRDVIDLIGSFVYDKRWFVVRNIAKVLGDIGSERALTFLKKTAEHTDQRVRVETLKALKAIPGTAAEKAILGFLQDPQRELRMRALRAIRQRGTRVSAVALKPVLDNSKVLKDDPDELREWFSAYARVGGDDAVAVLSHMATQRSWLGRKRLNPLRYAAIRALGMSPELRARAELAALSHAKESRIAQAAREAEKRWLQMQSEGEPAQQESEDSP